MGRRLVTSILLAWMLVGCSGPPTTGDPALDGVWWVREIGTTTSAITTMPSAGIWAFSAVAESRPPFDPAAVALITIENGTFTVDAPCNHVGMEQAAIDGERLTAVAMTWSGVGCAPDILEFESHVLTVIAANPAIALDGDSLTLTTTDGLTLGLVRVDPDPPPSPPAADPADFDGQWWLREVGTATEPDLLPPPADGNLGPPQALLTIDGDRVAVQGPCNRISVESSEINGDRFRWTFSATEKACAEEEFTAAERHLVEVLSDLPTLVVNGEELVVSVPDGRQLTFLRVDSEQAGAARSPEGPIRPTG